MSIISWLILILISVGLLVVCGWIVIRVSGKGSKGKFFLSVCGVMAVVIGMVWGYQFFVSENESVIQVALSTDETHDMLELEMPNRTVRRTPYYVEFRTELDWEAMIDLAETFYPNCNMILNEPEAWITLDNHTVRLKKCGTKKVLWKNYCIYEMQTESITLEASGGKRRIDIPFPKEYIVTEGAYETEMEIACDMDQLKEFYKDYSNVEINEESIIIEQDDRVEIKAENGKVHLDIL